jgi:hypothetical protein
MTFPGLTSVKHGILLPKNEYYLFKCYAGTRSMEESVGNQIGLAKASNSKQAPLLPHPPRQHIVIIPPPPC